LSKGLSYFSAVTQQQLINRLVSHSGMTDGRGQNSQRNRSPYWVWCYTNCTIMQLCAMGARRNFFRRNPLYLLSFSADSFYRIIFISHVYLMSPHLPVALRRFLIGG